MEDKDDGGGDDEDAEAHAQTQNPELYDALVEVKVQAGVHGTPQHHVHDLHKEKPVLSNNGAVSHFCSVY